MEIIFLGTTCMVPTKDRGHFAILLNYKSEEILIDCGEGTQRQLKLAGIKPTKITKILISHWHGDHVLGLPGLMQTLGASEYNGVLEIYGPEGTQEKINHMLKAFVFDNKVDFKVIEIKKIKFIENNDFFIEAFPLKHGIKSFGFIFTEQDKRRINLQYVRKLKIPDGPHLGKLQQGQDITYQGKKIESDKATKLIKGKKIGFIIDTVLCDNCYKIAQDADLLISESAYASEHEEKASEYKHLTSKQAGLIASQANAKRLILTHFSQRYKTTHQIEQDAKDVFKNVECAFDFMKVKL